MPCVCLPWLQPCALTKHSPSPLLLPFHARPCSYSSYRRSAQLGQLPKLKKKLDKTSKRHEVLLLIFGEQQEELDKLREQAGQTPPGEASPSSSSLQQTNEN